jgi:hypothetical protein
LRYASRFKVKLSVSISELSFNIGNDSAEKGEIYMIISPSVLAMDYSRMKEQMEEVNASQAEWLHFDVMD